MRKRPSSAMRSPVWLPDGGETTAFVPVFTSLGQFLGIPWPLLGVSSCTAGAPPTPCGRDESHRGRKVEENDHEEVDQRQNTPRARAGTRPVAGHGARRAGRRTERHRRL